MARDWNYQGRYGRDYDRRDDRSRDWSDRAGDEVRSWFGDDEAESRRMRDDRRDYGSRGGYHDRFGDDYSDTPAYAERGLMAGGGFGAYPGAYFNSGYRGAMSGRENRGFDDRPIYRRGEYYGNRGYGDTREDRAFLDRAGDEVASWFGDEDAQRRRQLDAGHRGRGPRNYTRSDERIREDVNDRLSDDPHLDASDVEITVSDGEVTLNGTVSKRFAKRHAEDIAENVSGVKHVQNNLRVNNRQTQGSSFGSTGSEPSTQLRSNADMSSVTRS